MVTGAETVRREPTDVLPKVKYMLLNKICYTRKETAHKPMSASCKEAFWVSFLEPCIFLMQKLSPDKLKIHRDPFQQQNSTKAVRLVLAVNWSAKDWLFKNFQEPSVFRDKKKKSHCTSHALQQCCLLQLQPRDQEAFTDRPLTSSSMPVSLPTLKAPPF